ncbi:Selenoprotein O and cysteine-containing homologs [hydrothermal vent metagenome]|uniref:Selenoprotein O and cysteine-containing homologs n=1 Tax=hydrothermal vent metagenome TaxID=652676 RepID=A0A1W1C069_9ZZZZ
MKLRDIELTNPYLKLPELCYDRVEPTPLKKPFLIHANRELAVSLGIDIDELESDDFLALINGELELNNSETFAMCYAGHQFGFFVDRLGDGRAINIGTIGGQHLQLKGAGTTLYSRGGDGRAVLRSSIREYLMSEAMYGLGIETTRALGIIGSEHRVYREDWESGAIVLRVSPSWVRFGTIEYFSHHKKYRELEALVDYVITESYPHLIDSDERYLKFFMEVVERTAKLIAKWQSVGFNHGVMNTDNMSIAGVTIDYGPYAFLDDYDFYNICNHTDRNGRYSFGNQPSVAKWNLKALMDSLSPMISIEKMELAIDEYDLIYQDHYISIMSQKLGFNTQRDGDGELIRDLLGVMQKLSVDYTLFFRTLSRYSGDRDDILKLCSYHKPMSLWLDSYDERVSEIDQSHKMEKMLSTNPKYTLKNYMLDEAISSANSGDFSTVDALFEIAKNPYDEHEEYERWSNATPSIYKNQMLSCSS